MSKMPSLPLSKVGAIRDAVRRKSVGLVGFNSVTTLFGRGQSTSSPSSTSQSQGEFAEDDEENMLSPTGTSMPNRGSRGSGERISGSKTEKPTTLVASSTYVEPPEPRAPPPGGLVESVKVNVQAKMGGNARSLPRREPVRGRNDRMQPVHVTLPSRTRIGFSSLSATAAGHPRVSGAPSCACGRARKVRIAWSLSPHRSAAATLSRRWHPSRQPRVHATVSHSRAAMTSLVSWSTTTSSRSRRVPNTSVVRSPRTHALRHRHRA